MKIAVTSFIGLCIVITTVMPAQDVPKDKQRTDNTIEYIKRETLGGKLDYTSQLDQPGHLPIDYKGVRFNKNDYHVFLWGQAISDLGLKSSTEACKLWEEIHGKKLTGPQRTALKIGFEKKIE